MRAIARLLCLLALSLVLSGCTPATYIRLYNATGQAITITSDMFRDVITIPPDTSADFSPVYGGREQLHIRTSTKSWDYSLRAFFPPHSFWRESFMVMRAYARIDARGYIYLLSPPRSDQEVPREARQPSGFPVTPQKT